MRSACERGWCVSWRCVWMVRGRSWCRVVHLHADGEELAEPRVGGGLDAEARVGEEAEHVLEVVGREIAARAPALRVRLCGTSASAAAAHGDGVDDEPEAQVAQRDP